MQYFDGTAWPVRSWTWTQREEEPAEEVPAILLVCSVSYVRGHDSRRALRSKIKNPLRCHLVHSHSVMRPAAPTHCGMDSRKQ